jgi:hypothetical protein
MPSPPSEASDGVVEATWPWNVVDFHANMTPGLIYI